MKVRVLFFATLRDLAGAGEAVLEIADGADLRILRDAVASRFPDVADRFRHVAWAVNGDLATDSVALHEDDEVALLPPVSGGGGLLVREPVRVEEVLAEAQEDRCGATVLFLGTVRNRSRGRDVTHLEYEAYEPMAERKLAEILDAVRGQEGILKAALRHRLGRMDVGDVSVAIAVSAPHRADAFRACRRLIDTLKKTVPIWKKEFAADGSSWIEESPLECEHCAHAEEDEDPS